MVNLIAQLLGLPMLQGSRWYVRYFMLTLHLQHAFIDRKARSRPAFMENHLVLAHSSRHAHITYSIMLLGFLLACSLTCLLTLFTSLSLVVCTLMAYHKCWLKTFFSAYEKASKGQKTAKKALKSGFLLTQLLGCSLDWAIKVYLLCYLLFSAWVFLNKNNFSLSSYLIWPLMTAFSKVTMM